MVSVQTCYSICALAAFLAGCAASPKEAANEAANEAVQDAPPTESSAVATSPTSAAAGTSSTSAAAAATSNPTNAGVSARLPDPAPSAVVDLAKQPANQGENTGQVCRPMLKPNTNSIITVCGTPAQWKQYKAAEARQAQELLLNMQGMRH